MEITNLTGFFEKNSPNITRREFVSRTTKGLSLVFAGSALLSFLQSCSTNSNPVDPILGKTVKIDINQNEFADLQTVGGTIALNSNDVPGLPSNGVLILRKTASDVTVLSRTCTHQGCQVNGFSNGKAYCPCHGSSFSTTGAVLNGPASSPLKSYSAAFDGSIITFNT